MVHQHKQDAIKLRRKGLTYREIQQAIPVAKSTLSGWVNHIVLTPSQVSRIAKLRVKGRRRASHVRRKTKQETILRIQNQAKIDLNSISKQELWLIGIALYWAEGNKQTPKNPSQRVQFSNSDPGMIRTFTRWLLLFEGVSPNQLLVELYIHESHIYRKNEIIEYWSSRTSIPPSSFDRIYTKRNKSKIDYQDRAYFGLVRLGVRKSTNLNRKLKALSEVMSNRCGIV